MSILNSSIVPVGTTGGYTIDNSIRLNDDDSAYLSRTPSTAGNQKTWTFSCWLKRGNLGIGNFPLFSVNNPIQYYDAIRFDNGETFSVIIEGANYGGTTLTSGALFRDTSAWYHIIVAMDTTQATEADRCKVYINGVAEAVNNIPALNYVTGVNSAQAHYVGKLTTYTEYADGYLAEVNFVDGQALTPSDFGETDEDYGHWKAKKYAGTYGTNGFYLDFKNSGSLGNDVSGAGNNWTPNNLAATDQMLDSPTNNFATLNPLQRNSTNITVSEGNLKSVGSGGWQTIGSSHGISSGKWYWEVCNINAGLALVGVVDTNNVGALFSSSVFVGNLANSYGYYSGDGKKYNITSTAYGATWQTIGDIIGIAYDADIGSLTFYKNNVSQGVAFTSLTNNVIPAFSPHTGVQLAANFGQDSSFAGNKTSQGNADDNGYGDFYYTPPTGFLALCTQNLPEPTVVPSEHFNTVLYTGDGTASHAVTGVGFQPDFLWIKSRSEVRSHQLLDAVRGATNYLNSDTTNAEGTSTVTVTSFDSDGFTTGIGNAYNASGQTFASWNWKANGAGVSNTDGSITSTVSANVDAGFSIVNFTGTGANATVGHGLNSAPEMIIFKNRDNTSSNWITYAEPIGNTYNLFLNLTNAKDSDGALYWQSTSPTSTVFTAGGYSQLNASGQDTIGYAFHSVEGYSKVGSYTGNGSTDGTFVHCGFRPAYVMVKATTDSSRYWAIHDNKRLSSSYNKTPIYGLFANSSGAESDVIETVDLLSNGFKWRTHAGDMNDSGGTYIFLAFAEHPFKYSTAK